MKRLLIWTLLLIVSVPAFAQHPLIDRICQKLNGYETCRTLIEFQVTQPMTNEEVVYHLSAICMQTPHDSLSRYAYYIEVDSASHPMAQGNFCTYFEGHYYDFSNERLREYHMPQDSVSFRPILFRGKKSPGVHESGLFVGEVPLKLVDLLQSVLQDSCYQVEERPFNPAQGRPYDEISIRRYVQDELVRTIDLSFDPESGRPLLKEIENSPNKVGSQTVITHYQYPENDSDIASDFFSEARLLRDKKEIMEQYRTSDYRADLLSGRKMPEFSLQELNKPDRFDSKSAEGKPLILAFVKSNCSFCDSTLQVLNRMKGESPVLSVALFTDKLPQVVEPEIEEQAFAGTVLYNAGDVALNYGVYAYPTLFVVGTDGKIAKIQAGYARNLLQILTQEINQFK